MVSAAGSWWLLGSSDLFFSLLMSPCALHMATISKLSHAPQTHRHSLTPNHQLFLQSNLTFFLPDKNKRKWLPSAGTQQLALGFNRVLTEGTCAFWGVWGFSARLQCWESSWRRLDAMLPEARSWLGASWLHPAMYEPSHLSPHPWA